MIQKDRDMIQEFTKLTDSFVIAARKEADSDEDLVHIGSVHIVSFQHCRIIFPQLIAPCGCPNCKDVIVRTLMSLCIGLGEDTELDLFEILKEEQMERKLLTGHVAGHA